MGEITWIKLKTNMFDNQKVRLIEALPEADTLLVIWIKLLTAAGKVNCNGYIMITEKIPMGIEEMATIFNRPLNTVRLAISTFKRYGMIEMEGDDVIRIANWDKHQNIEGMDKIREQERLRKQKQREKQRLLLGQSRDSHGTVTQNHATESDLDLDLEKELESDKEKEQHHQEREQNLNLINDDDDDNFQLIANKFLSLKTSLDNKKAVLREKDMQAIKRVQALNLNVYKVINLIEDCFTIFKINQTGTISSFSYVETFIINSLNNSKGTTKKVVRKENIPEHMKEEFTETKPLDPEEARRLKEQLQNLNMVGAK